MIGSIGLQTTPQILYISGFTAVVCLNPSVRDGQEKTLILLVEVNSIKLFGY